MIVRDVVMAPGEDLIISRKHLAEAGLGPNLKLVIHKGEICIRSDAEIDNRKVLDELAGCLGEEPADAYDFKLKLGGLYEAR